MKTAGYYFGSEVDERWYRSYMAAGFFARGRGKYWFDDQGMYFLRYLTLKPLFIPFAKIINIKLGKWHSGKWGQGHIVVKVIWDKDSIRLSSGFILAKSQSESMQIVNSLRSKIQPLI